MYVSTKTRCCAIKREETIRRLQGWLARPAGRAHARRSRGDWLTRLLGIPASSRAINQGGCRSVPAWRGSSVWYGEWLWLVECCAWSPPVSSLTCSVLAMSPVVRASTSGRRLWSRNPRRAPSYPPHDVMARRPWRGLLPRPTHSEKERERERPVDIDIYNLDRRSFDIVRAVFWTCLVCCCWPRRRRRSWSPAGARPRIATTTCSAEQTTRCAGSRNPPTFNSPRSWAPPSTGRSTRSKRFTAAPRDTSVSNGEYDYQGLPWEFFETNCSFTSCLFSSCNFQWTCV